MIHFECQSEVVQFFCFCFPLSIMIMFLLLRHFVEKFPQCRLRILGTTPPLAETLEQSNTASRGLLT